MRRATLYAPLLVVAASLISCCSFVAGGLVVKPSPWLYEQIHFEIAPIASNAPSTAALELFRSRLHQNRICRRDRIVFDVHNASYKQPPFPWNSVHIRNYEKQVRRNRDVDPHDGELHVFVAYVTGIWIEDGFIRPLGGIQYEDTSFVVFKPRSKTKEASILLHEFGHLIGLVKDTTLPNHDSDHRYHCDDETCVMYWTAPDDYADYDAYCKQQIAELIRVRNSAR